MTTPEYNVDHAPTLLEAGTFGGRAIGIDQSTIRPLEGRPIFLANLGTAGKLHAASKLRGGVEATVAVKVVEEDRSRIPRDGRREARLLARLAHPSVRRYGPSLRLG
jgi:hypothetical protein